MSVAEPFVAQQMIANGERGSVGSPQLPTARHHCTGGGQRPLRSLSVPQSADNPHQVLAQVPHALQPILCLGRHSVEGNGFLEDRPVLVALKHQQVSAALQF